jgi:murein L,D-transpeptidase YcbB/YkuD
MIHRKLATLIGPKALVVAAAPLPGPMVATPRPDQAAVLYRTLLAADRVGLDPADLTPALDRLLSSGQQDATDTHLVEAAVRYAADLRRGRTPTTSFRRDWAIRPPAFDARGELYAALAADRLESWLANLAPRCAVAPEPYANGVGVGMLRSGRGGAGRVTSRRGKAAS